MLFDLTFRSEKDELGFIFTKVNTEFIVNKTNASVCKFLI